LGLNAAYHTTICKLPAHTNQHLGKKFGDLPGSRRVAPYSMSGSPVARALFPRLRPAPAGSPAFIEVIAIHPRKRTKYMSNLPFAVPAGAGDPPRSHSQSSGALAVQICLAFVPAIPEPATPPAVPLPEKTFSPPPAPLPSTRCSEKGCVYPAVSLAQTTCRYHELLQSGVDAELFESRQPSYLLALYAPFGIPDDEPDDSRQQDRQRQVAEREKFLLDQADEAA
jgi:hypothetical protein